MSFAIRPPEITDRNFIFTTWLKGLYFGNDWFEEIEFDTFFKAYKEIIERILIRSGISINILHPVDSPEIIIGYAIFEPGLLHWIFVKPSFRRANLSKQLLTEEFKVCTHSTRLVRQLIRKKGLKFNPFLGGRYEKESSNGSTSQPDAVLEGGHS